MFEKRYAIRDWPNPETPSVRAGVYAIWREPSELVFVGMSGRSIESAGNKSSTASLRAWHRMRVAD